MQSLNKLGMALGSWLPDALLELAHIVAIAPEQPMASSRTTTFIDPEQYQASVRAATMRTYVQAAGVYKAELIRLDFDRLWMQRSRVSLAMIADTAVAPGRSVVLFLADTHQPPVWHGGRSFSPGDLMFDALRAEHYVRTSGEYRWASMSLAPDDLARAGRTLLHRDLAPPSSTQRLRPAPSALARLTRLHAEAGKIAKLSPEVLTHPEVARAIEQQLIRSLVSCLSEGEPVGRGSRKGQAIMRRLEDLLVARPDEPLYIAEICGALGVAERTLRLYCHEHLGMSPHRYLWLRRMNLARRALIRSDGAGTRVTAIAMNYGFGELGRFAGEYKRLFGEPPSATLRRSPHDPMKHPKRPLAEFA